MTTTIKENAPDFVSRMEDDKITIFQHFADQLFAVLNARHPDEGNVVIEVSNNTVYKVLEGSPEEFEKVLPLMADKSEKPWAFLELHKGRTKTKFTFSHPGLKELVNGVNPQ